MKKFVQMTMLLTVLLVLAGCPEQQPTAAVLPDGSGVPPAATAPEVAAPAELPVAGVRGAPPAASAVVPEVLVLNRDKPGVPFDLAPHLVAGQITLVDFYSEFCPPCVRIAPALEKLAAARPDLVVRKLDINRPGVQGIDWGSPLAQQYGLNSIPHFKIYDAQGKLIAEGEAASQQLFGWLQAANISL